MDVPKTFPRRDFLRNSQKKQEAIEKLAVGRVDSVLFTKSFPNKNYVWLVYSITSLDFLILPSEFR